METKAWIVRVGEDYNRAKDDCVSLDHATRLSGESWMAVAKSDMRKAQQAIAHLNACLALELA